MYSLSRDRMINEESLDNILKNAFDLAEMGAWSCDLRTERLSWTPAVFDMFGLPRDRTVDRREVVAMYAEPCRRLLEQLRVAAIANRTTFALEARIIRPDGTPRWVRIKASTKVENGRAVTLYGLKQDITTERQQWARLRHLTDYDPLTGLADRMHFQAVFFDRSVASDLCAPPGALALFAVDNLAEINRRWGYAAGDGCLIAFARRLLSAGDGGAFTARLGGGEFAMLLDGAGKTPHLEPGPSERFSHLGDPVLWNGVSIPLGISIGIVFVRRFHGHEAEAIYARADLARQVARRQAGRSPRIVSATFEGGKQVAVGSAPSAGAPAGAAGVGMPSLSPREMEALRHISCGRTIDEIAHEMAVSSHTVRNFIRRIYQKMEVDTRVEAVQRAYRNGLL